MKTSLFINAPAAPTGAEQHSVLQEILAIAEFADVSGFDRFLVTEHHSASLGAVPDPLQLLAAVAARTLRIGLGTAAVILSLSHPLRVAEAVAQLDALSGGRASLGLARGFDQREFAAFDVSHPDADDFFQGVATVRRLLHGDALRPCTVGPVPVSVAASSPESYERVGLEGLPVLTNPYFCEPRQFEAMVDRYRAAARAAGAVPHVMAHVIAVVAPTDAEATRTGGPAVDEYLRLRSDGRFSFTELQAGRRVAVGSAETVSHLLDRYAELGVDEVAVNPLVGIADPGIVSRTVELLAPGRRELEGARRDAAVRAAATSPSADAVVTPGPRFPGDRSFARR